MARRRAVVVVGAGVMGSATAWALARRGIDTVVLEQFEAGHDRGSSHGASRIFRLAYEDALYARFAGEALAGWRALEEEAGAHLLTRTGGIDHGDREPLDRIAGALSEIGAAFEFIGSSAAAARWPGIRFAGEVLVQPDAGVLNADAAVAAFLRCAADRGAEMRFGVRVISLEPREGGILVATTADEIDADVVVLTAGSWLPTLAVDLVALPPLLVTQEQPAYFAPRDAETAWPVFVHRLAAGESLEGVAAYGLPTPGHGLKVGEHGTGPQVDPDRRADPDAAGIARLSRYVEDWLPGLDPAPRELISCLYTTAPGEHFVVGRVGRVVVGSPCSGHGFKFAPAMGELLASLATEGRNVPAAWATVSRRT
jgi:sarcosine oxidase